MPPVPARIARTPRQNSRRSWNPAVPPPPVPGAPVGNDLADGLRDGDGLGDGDRPGLGVAAPGVTVLDAAALGAAALAAVVLGAVAPGTVAPGVTAPDVVARGTAVLGVVTLGVLTLGVVALGAPAPAVAPGVPLAEPAGVAGPVPPGENGGGPVDDEPDEQAATDAVASMARAAQPRAVPRKRRRP